MQGRQARSRRAPHPPLLHGGSAARRANRFNGEKKKTTAYAPFFEVEHSLLLQRYVGSLLSRNPGSENFGLSVENNVRLAPYGS